MFPETQHQPARFSESLVRVLIPGPVTRDFFTPELHVCPRCCVVLRAAVPEAPVDKYRDSLSREDDVGTPPSVKRERVIHAVARALSEELLPDC